MAACLPASRFRQDTRTDFLLHLNELHYAYTEETDNPAYKIFLGAEAGLRPLARCSRSAAAPAALP